LYEQHHGYFGLEPIELSAYEPRNTAMDVILGHARIQQTNVVKQADVIMAMFLLWDQFTAPVREVNFRYYEPRTGHGSSLSPSIHALVAARIGDLALADKYLRQAAEIDLGNNMGNAAGGIHAAAIGGLWQAMVLGFSGVQMRPDGLELDPNLLPHWTMLEFPLTWRGRQLRVSVQPERVRVRIEEGREPMELAIGDAAVTAHPRREYEAARQNSHWGQWRETHM
jgi:kojibiose phosphorylase